MTDRPSIYTKTEAVMTAARMLGDCGWKNDGGDVWVYEPKSGKEALIARLKITPEVALAIIHGSELFDSMHLGPAAEVI